MIMCCHGDVVSREHCVLTLAFGLSEGWSVVMEVWFLMTLCCLGDVISH